MMQFITFDQPGAADSLYLTSGRRPSLNPGEILIKVAARGVNRPDIMQRAGRYPAPEGANPILGLEVAGRRGQRIRCWRARLAGRPASMRAYQRGWLCRICGRPG